MATHFSQDTVLHFLQMNGGMVKNADLLLYFRNFLRDHADQDRNRELFKKFVNSVATVRQTDGVSYVVLRKKFKGHVPGGGFEGSSGLTQWLPAGKHIETSAEKTNLNTAVNEDLVRSKLLQKDEITPAPPREAAKTTILPVAGLILNNNNNVETKIKHKQVNRTPEPSGGAAAAQVSQQVPSLLGPFVPDQCTKLGQLRTSSPSPGITPVVPAHRETYQQPPSCLHPQVAPRRARHRQSYKSAVSYDDDEEEEEVVPLRRGSAGGVWPLNVPLSDIGKSASSPCLIDQPAPQSISSSGRMPPKIYIQDIEGQNRTPWGSGVGLKGQCPPGPGLDSGEFVSMRRSLPAEAAHCVPSVHHTTEAIQHHNIQQDHRYSQNAGVQLGSRSDRSDHQRQRLSSSHSSIFSHSSDTGFCSSSGLTSASPRLSGGTSSYEDLHSRPGHLYDNQEHKARLSPLHQSNDHIHDNQDSTGRPIPRHLSTGDLCDDQGVSTKDSICSPQLRQRPAVTRRLSTRLRSRMCRSMGADLDQLLQEEEAAGRGGIINNEAARLNRLHRISSSLSLRYNLSSSSLSSCSTPPRCNSLADLVEGVDGRGKGKIIPTDASPQAHHENRSRQSLVPLEPREHAWLVKAAAGTWPDIYSLFREDSSLLNKRDFISGFTVLHWIAKHGDHRVLNTLWYGVEKAGLTFDINARATSGHTPLHIATIHGNKNIIRLLVSKFNADVRIRDNAGKRPWQYLSRTAPLDVFQMLGAPARAVLTGEGGGAGNVDSNWEQQQQQRRRRRHHLSSASSGHKPLMVGTAKVKRSSSLAAFLKHKSLQRFYAQTDSSV